MSRFILKIVDKLRVQKISLGSFFITLLAIIVIRTQLEFIIEFPKSIVMDEGFYFLVVDYGHFIFSWLTIFLNIILIVSFFAKDKILTTANVGLFLFPIIISVPLLDLALGTQMKIMYQFDFSNFIFNYIHTFNFFETKVSFPYGVRIEVFSIILLSSFYTFVVSKKILRALLNALSIYTMIFFYAYLPAIIEIFFPNFSDYSTLQFSYVLSVLFYMYIPVGMILFVWLYFKLPNNYQRVLIQSIRIERLLIYGGIFCLGIMVALKTSSSYNILNFSDILKIAAGLISISSIFIYSTILNDIYDEEIDKVTNQKRPLVRKDISFNNYKALLYGFLFMGIIFAITVNKFFIFLLLFLISLSFIYSASPFRLRKYFLVSSFILALIASFTYVLGTVIVHGYETISLMDWKLFFVLFLVFFIASNLKDIKDIEGDKKNNVITFGTLFGREKSYIILTISTILIMLFTGFYLKIGYFWIFMATMIFTTSSYLFKNSEKLILSLQVSVLFLIIGYLFF